VHYDGAAGINNVVQVIEIMLSVLTIFSALVCLVMLYTRRKDIGLSRHRITDDKMNSRFFAVRYSKKAVESNFLMILAAVALGIFVYFISEEGMVFVFVVFIVAVASVAGALHTLHSIMFSCTVIDGVVTCRTLIMGTRSFSINDIKQIAVVNIYPLTAPYRIMLLSKKDRTLMTINPHNVDHLGYQLFVELLKESEISGWEDLPLNVEPAQEYMVSHRSFDFCGRILFIVQCIFLLFAIAVFFIAEGVQSSLTYAYSAMDVLVGYAEWYPILIGILVAVVAVMLSANALIILFLDRSGRNIKVHIWTAAISITAIVVLFGGFILFEDIPGLKRDTQTDIAAVESGELIEVNFLFHLSWENFYRPASIRDIGGYSPLYVIRHNELGRIYFPRSLSPSALREHSESEIFQIPEAAPGTRMFALAVTPQLQIVVDAIPIEKFSANSTFSP